MNIDELLEKYKNEKAVYTRDEWEKVIKLDEFELEFDGNVEDIYHNYNLIDPDDDDVWNDKIKSISDFSIEDKTVKSIKSDYYTKLSTKKELENNKDHYLREGIFNNDMTELSKDLSVLSTVILDLEDETKLVYHKRSDNVGVNPNNFSSIPNGKVDMNHSSLVECCKEEFKEELLGDNDKLMNQLDFSIYYTGTCITLDLCSFQLVSLIYLEGKDAIKALENFEKSQESKRIFVDSVDEITSKLGDEINIYNSSIGGYYCIERSLDCYEKVRKLENN